MTNQINRNLNLQATDQAADIAYQPEQLSSEELEGVAGGSPWWAGVNWNGSDYSF